MMKYTYYLQHANKQAASDSKQKALSNKQAGMTLIELMVATVILISITSVAVPSMRDLFTRKNVEHIVPLFERSLHLARVQATQRRLDVRVKPTSHTGDWSQGWFIEYTDPDDGVIVTHNFDALSGTPVFNSNDFNQNSDLTFTPTGQALNTGGFDLYYTGCSGNGRFTLRLLLSGLLRKTVSACPP